jgi:hypothetical protein
MVAPRLPAWNPPPSRTSSSSAFRLMAAPIGAVSPGVPRMAWQWNFPTTQNIRASRHQAAGENRPAERQWTDADALARDRALRHLGHIPPFMPPLDDNTGCCGHASDTLSEGEKRGIIRSLVHQKPGMTLLWSEVLGSFPEGLAPPAGREAAAPASPGAGERLGCES